jgi:hypothetical protein
LLLAAAAAAAVQTARGGPRAAFLLPATVGVTTAAARVTVLRLVFRQLRASAQQLTRRRQCPGPGRKQCPGPIGPARRRAQCSKRSRAPYRYLPYLPAVKRVESHENFACFGSIADLDSSRFCRSSYEDVVCGSCTENNTYNCIKNFCGSGLIFPVADQGFFVQPVPDTDPDLDLGGQTGLGKMFR